MDYRKEILKAFNIQEGQRFKIRYNGTLLASIYHFDRELNCVSGDETFTVFTLSELIKSTGNIKLEPLPFWNQEDEIIFRYVKLCGMRWIAVDKSGLVHAFKERPSWIQDSMWCDFSENRVTIHHELSCLSWCDEPLDLDMLNI